MSTHAGGLGRTSLPRLPAAGRAPAQLLVLGAVVLLATAAAYADEPQDTCVMCHTALPEPLNLAVEGMKGDIHAEKGLSCVDCHGGDATTMDPTASMSPEKGFRGKPAHADIPEFCGHCHADPAYMRRFNPRLPTDQLQQYWTSVHGQRLRQGDQKVATCVSCHGVHGIRPPGQAQSRVFAATVPGTCGHCHSDAQYMAEYGIPTDQEEKYRRSVHGELLLVQRDLSAPACNDCHGNHGAFPPGVRSIAGVCGQCHVNDAALFEKSPHKPAFDAQGLPECAACHGNHEIHRTSDSMLGTNDGAVCRRCHQPGTAGYAAAATMRDAVERLKAAMAEAETRLDRASHMGMEVSEEQFAFQDSVRPQLITLRTETHRADAQAIEQLAQEGIAGATASAAAATAKIDEAAARRRHLLLPLALIALLMVFLYVKLRRIERGTA